MLLILGTVCCYKTIIPEHRSTFLPLQHAATLIFSVDWGLGIMYNKLVYAASEVTPPNPGGMLEMALVTVNPK